MAYGIYDNGELIARFAVPLTLRSNVPVFVSDTLSLRRKGTKRAAQRWELNTNVEPLAFGAEDLMVHLITKGYTDTMTLTAPQNVASVRRRTSISTPTAVGASGASSVTVTNNTGLIPKGTFVKFAGGTKVYMTTADRLDNGPMSIFPTLRAATNGIFTHRDDVLMTCFYDSDVITGMVYQDGILMDPGNLKFVEYV
jgi:hypothetical protein